MTVVHEGLGQREIGISYTRNLPCFCGRFFLTYSTLILLLYVNCISRYEMIFEIMIFDEFSLDFSHFSNTCLQWIARSQIVQGGDSHYGHIYPDG